MCQMVGFYDCECFVGATLQIDADGNSSTAIKGRISGFGGAPNLGSNPVGRRHVSPAWLKVGQEMAAARGLKGVDVRGHKLIVQLTPTRSTKKNIPVFVEELDANQMAEQGIFQLPPVMIYGDDITHIVTEKGIAYLCRCANREERRAAIRAVAGLTPVGANAVAAETASLRQRKIVAYPEDLDIQPETVTTKSLAAQSIADLVDISGGRFKPLPKFR
jgi:malonate decarboxylase alpha subunit